MIRIESLDDARVADYRLVLEPAALLRAGLLVAEGRFVVRRILGLERFRVRSVLVTRAAFEDLGLAGPENDATEDAAGGLFPSVFVVDQRVMEGVVGFNVHRGCLAIAERPAPIHFADLMRRRLIRVLILEGVSNPDNIGGLFRSAAAFGVDAVILGPGCSDPLYRKAIRTSMAATLQVPFADAGDWPQALHTLRDTGLTVLALTPDADAPLLDDVAPPDRVALLVGAEGLGLTTTAMAATDGRVRIRTSAEVDSLNVTVAASIALHHFA